MKRKKYEVTEGERAQKNLYVTEFLKLTVGVRGLLLLLLLLLLLYDMDVSCYRPFLPGTSLEPTAILTAQTSSFTLQYFPYYV
jgi:hypothetical protein